MGLLTDFFVASEEEVKAAFPTWLAVAAKKNRETINPFTGEKLLTWGPAEPQKSKRPKKGKLFDIRPFPHCQYKRVDLIKLATLMELTCGISFKKSLNALEKPALIDPASDEQGLHRLPANLSEALAGLTDKAGKATAKKWSQTEELQLDEFSQDDAHEIVQSLRKLSVVAQKEGKGLFTWWSL